MFFRQTISVTFPSLSLRWACRHRHTHAFAHTAHTHRTTSQMHLSHTSHTPHTNTSHTPHTHLTHTSHTPLTHFTHTSHTPLTHLTHTSHTHLTHTLHTHLTHTSHTPHTPHIPLSVWADCDGKLCLHGGTLNLKTCTCTCPSLYSGDTCQTREYTTHIYCSTVPYSPVYTSHPSKRHTLNLALPFWYLVVLK